MHQIAFSTAFVALAGCAAGAATPLEPPSAAWMDSTLPAEERAQKLLTEMRLDEKLVMLHGIPNNVDGDVIYVGLVKGNHRLGIPQLRLNDGSVSQPFSTHIICTAALLMIILIPLYSSAPKATATTSTLGPAPPGPRV